MVTGPAGAGDGRDKGEAEQVLLDKALKDYRYLFTPWRLWIMGRNFPGAPRIKAMLATGTHVLIRVKNGVTLRRAGDFLPDGSYLATISGGGITLTVRVIEYHVTVAGRDTPELFCLITDLHDHDAYPAAVLAHAYHWRWIGSETLLKEAKSAITGAGPSTGPVLRSQSPALVAQEHAAWVTAVELARAAAAVAVPARRGRRAGQPVHPRQISFTAARRAIIGLARSGAATASLAAPLITANRDRILAAWPDAGSPWTAAGTATARPRTARASPPADPARPPALPRPKSASAAARRLSDPPQSQNPPASGTGRPPGALPRAAHCSHSQ